jgi:hypothetical protein
MIIWVVLPSAERELTLRSSFRRIRRDGLEIRFTTRSNNPGWLVRVLTLPARSALRDPFRDANHLARRTRRTRATSLAKRRYLRDESERGIARPEASTNVVDASAIAGAAWRMPGEQRGAEQAGIRRAEPKASTMTEAAKSSASPRIGAMQAAITSPT